MNTKTCKHCGWVYPITQPGVACRICKTPFDIVVCRMCGNVVSGDERVKSTNLCKACFNSINRASSAKSKAKRTESLEGRFNAWIAKVKSVPKNYPTLTEEQWLAACKHFDGCARCHSDTVDARGFFISAVLGGRYCDWNIIPLCERCANTWNLDKSTFVYTLNRDHIARTNDYRECLENIVEYLEVKLDAAITHTAPADEAAGRH